MTYAQSVAGRAARWVAIVTIEGSGTADGLYRYCSDVPDYAGELYRPWLRDWPRLMSERAPAGGGMPEAGELEVNIVDVGDALTSEWRTEAAPLTYLSGALTADAASLSLDDDSTVVEGTILYIGNEAIECLGAPAAGVISVSRGALDTDATPHGDGDAVYAYLPYLERRRARLYLVPKDAPSSSEEQLVGSFRIDQRELSEDLCSWVLRGATQLRWLSRLVARRPSVRMEVLGARTDSATVSRIGPWDFAYGDPFDRWSTPTGRLLLKNERTEEILSASPVTSAPSLALRARGLYGTQPAELQAGDVLRRVWGADPLDDPDGPTSFFRWAAAGSPPVARNGSWTASAQWVNLLLNLATSSAAPGDGLELDNRDATYGAWDCLPIGIGIGVPHSQIDWQAALDVRARTPDYTFERFVIDEPVEFGELVTESFLRIVGGYISTVGGLARIVLPRMPLAGASALTIGTADVLRRRVGEGVYGNRLGLAKDTSALVSTIVYELASGDTITVVNGDYRGTFGQAGYYQAEDRPLRISARAVRPDANGSNAMLEACAVRRMLTATRPPWIVQTPRDWSALGYGVGTAVELTYPDLPNLADGTRGWTSVPAELAETRAIIDPEEGVHHEWTLRTAPGSGRAAGRVAPAARVVSVAIAGGNATVTVSANRYTQTDAQDGLPVTDAAAFAIGDELGLYNRNGTTATGTTQTVTAVGANSLTLDGTFGGTLTVGTGQAGLVLRYAPSSAAATQQLDGYVYEADRATRTIGATARAPWRYGQP